MLAELTKLDQQGYLWVVAAAERYGLRRPARYLSRSGDGPLYLCLCLMLWLLDAEGERLFRLCLCAFLLELPLYLLLKHSIRRTRPCHSAIGARCEFEPSDKFSLPSGHTAAAFVMCLSLGECYPPLLVPALLWAGGIGASRVALGVHYPSDIIAGAALGTCCVSLANVFN